MNVEFPDFPCDHSQSNPGLHMLYVKTAAKHLGIVDKMIRKLYNQSNSNANEFARALEVVREKKIKEDTAYRDASEMLYMARTGEDLEVETPEEVKVVAL